MDTKEGEPEDDDIASEKSSPKKEMVLQEPRVIRPPKLEKKKRMKKRANSKNELSTSMSICEGILEMNLEKLAEYTTKMT